MTSPGDRRFLSNKPVEFVMSVKNVTFIDNAKLLLASEFLNFSLLNGVAVTFLTSGFLVLYCNTI